MKKILLLCAFVVLSFSAFSAGIEIGGVNYTLNRTNLTASVTYRVWPKDASLNPISASENLYTGDVVIPSEVSYLDTIYRVTGIGDNAFFGSKRMTSVAIPTSVKTVGYMAFAWCSGLNELTFPDSITSMGQYMFTGDMSKTVISCLALVPPAVAGNDLGAALTIHVPAEVIPKYKNALGWSRHTIKSILLDAEKTTEKSANVTWFPVETVDTYQVCVEAYLESELVYADTLYIVADSENGGVMTAVAAAPSRHVPMDGGGTIIVITIDPTSGASAGQPFLLTVSTAQDDLLDCRVKVIAYHEGVIVKQDQIMFSLNDSLSIANIFASSLPTGIYDLYGHRYTVDQWSSLPAGVYVVREEDRVEKVMKI